MGFNRLMIQDGGLERVARVGDGYSNNPVRTAMAVDAASVITLSSIFGGLIIRTNATAARIDTTDTAAVILAACPSMDIGDSLEVTYVNQSVSTITIAGGTGVTASGFLAIPTLTSRRVILFKTSATTMDLVAL